MMAGANRHIGRTDTIGRQKTQRLFCNTILQGMEGNDTQTSSAL